MDLKVYTLATGISLMVFYVYRQCNVWALAVVKKEETKNMEMGYHSIGIYIGLAYKPACYNLLSKILYI